MKISSQLNAITAVLAAMMIAAGAYNAHSIQNDAVEQAIFYGLIHVLAILAIPLQNRRFSSVIRGLWFAGIWLFSMNLIGAKLLSFSSLSPLTPFGGVSFMIGWCLASIVFIKENQVKTK